MPLHGSTSATIRRAPSSRPSCPEPAARSGRPIRSRSSLSPSSRIGSPRCSCWSSRPGSAGGNCAGSSGRTSTSTNVRSPCTTVASWSQATHETKQVVRPRTPISGISIDRATASALDRWRGVQDRERDFFGTDYQRGDYVFTFEDAPPPHPDTIRQRFDRLAAAAGLSRITFHDLRHSYATGALKAGVSPKVISERIGHANVGCFLETYGHVVGSDDRDAAEQAAAFLIG